MRGMSPGGIRRLIIPSRLAYQSSSASVRESLHLSLPSSSSPSSPSSSSSSSPPPSPSSSYYLSNSSPFCRL